MHYYIVHVQLYAVVKVKAENSMVAQDMVEDENFKIPSKAIIKDRRVQSVRPWRAQ